MNTGPTPQEHPPLPVDALGCLEISTNDIDPAKRFEFWRNEFNALHQVDVEPSRRYGFEAWGRFWMLGSILFGISQTPARTITRTKDQTARDDLHHWFIRVVRKGRIATRSEKSSFVMQPGQIAIGSYADAYEEAHTANEWLVAIVPRKALPHLECEIGDPRILHGAPSALLADFLIALEQRLPQITPAELPQVGAALLGMISVCLAPSEYCGWAKAPIGCVREHVDTIIAKHISSSRLTPARVAELAGISRSTLYRAFETEDGVAQHICRKRLELVRRDLESPLLAGVPIYQVAERRGLHNVASFNRSFRRQFGLTPSDVRAAARDAFPKTSLSPASSHFIDLIRSQDI